MSFNGLCGRWVGMLPFFLPFPSSFFPPPLPPLLFSSPPPPLSLFPFLSYPSTKITLAWDLWWDSSTVCVASLLLLLFFSSFYFTLFFLFHLCNVFQLDFVSYAPEKIPYGIERYTKEAQRLLKVLDTQLAKNQFVAKSGYPFLPPLPSSSLLFPPLPSSPLLLFLLPSLCYFLLIYSL